MEREGAAALQEVAADVAALLMLEGGRGAVTLSVSDARAGVAARCGALQAELDGMMAAQCFLCGDIMVDSVSVPIDAGMEGEWDL